MAGSSAPPKTRPKREEEASKGKVKCQHRKGKGRQQSQAKHAHYKKQVLWFNLRNFKSQMEKSASKVTKPPVGELCSGCLRGLNGWPLWQVGSFKRNPSDSHPLVLMPLCHSLSLTTGRI